MKWLIDASMRFRGIVIAVAAGALVFGLVQLPDAPVDALPEFKETVVEVQTEALGLSAEEVEQLITVPLEQDLLNGIAFLQDIESVSLPGLSSVVMTFEPGTDLLDARQVVAERLTQAVGVAGLPNVASPPQMLQPLSSTNRAGIVRLSSSELTPIEMSVLARWVIAPRLMGVEGVANVAIWGQRERQLQILVDPANLQAEGVSLNQVIRTSGNALEVSPLSFLEASSPGTGGFIDTANQRLQVFHEQAIKTPADLATIPLEDEDGNAFVRDGALVTLGEVSRIVEDHQPLIGDALCSDGDCQLLVIERFPDANLEMVASGVEEALDVMRPGMAGLDMDTSIYRPAEYVDEAVGNIRTVSIIGGILLLLALIAIFWSWRPVLVVALTTLISLAAAYMVLLIRGAPMNLLTIAGITAGVLIVIDEAITDTHELAGRVKASDDDDAVSADRRIRATLLTVKPSSFYALLIVAAAALPALFLEGVGGAFLPALVTSYLLAAGASLIVSLTVAPSLSRWILDGTGEARFGRWLHGIYDRKTSSGSFRFGTALALFVVVMALGAESIVLMNTDLEPELRERDVLVEVEAAPGTSLIRMTDMTESLVDEIAAIPGVRSVGAHVGRAIQSDQVTNVNSAAIWVNIERNADYDATVDSVKAIAAAAPADVATGVRTHTAEQVGELLGTTTSDIVVRVYGENDQIRADKAEEIRQQLARIDGLRDITVDHPPVEPAIEVTVDLPAAQSVGLKPGDVRRTAAILMNGITVGNLFDEQKVFDVVVWGVPEIRTGLGSVENLLVETENFGRVRIGTVADVVVAEEPAVIPHESVATYLDVIADVEGRSVAAVAREVDTAVARVSFPLEHHAELLGDFTDARNNRWLIAALAFGAVAFILLLLQSAFASWRLAFVMLITLPMAVAGGLAAAFITADEVTLGTVIGLLAVLTLATRNGVLLFRRYQLLQRTKGVSLGPELTRRGTRERLVPVMATTVAAIAVFLPFAVSGRIAGMEIIQPAAVVIIGGLLTSLLHTFVVLPAAYGRYAVADQVGTWGEELFDVSLTDIEDEAIVGAAR